MTASGLRLQDAIAEMYRYLDGDVPLSNFSRFLAPLAWDSSGLDPETKDFVSSAYLRLAEFTSRDLTGGHPTEDELRHSLHELLPVTQTVWVEWGLTT